MLEDGSFIPMAVRTKGANGLDRLGASAGLKRSGSIETMCRLAERGDRVFTGQMEHDRNVAGRAGRRDL